MQLRSVKNAFSYSQLPPLEPPFKSHHDAIEHFTRENLQTRVHKLESETAYQVCGRKAFDSTHAYIKKMISFPTVFIREILHECKKKMIYLHFPSPLLLPMYLAGQVVLTSMQGCLAASNNTLPIAATRGRVALKSYLIGPELSPKHVAPSLLDPGRK
jgi:hypothetical protein